MTEKGFIAALFDFSFTDLITPKIIKFLYALCIGLAAIGALVFILGGFKAGAMYGLGALIVSPVVFLLYAIAARVYMEILIVMFRISRHVQEIAERGRK